jgi:hypothetical protein
MSLNREGDLLFAIIVVAIIVAILILIGSIGGAR